MAAAMLRHRLDARGVDVEVSSAGFVTEDRPAPREVLDVLEARGLDGRSHRSRRLQVGDLAGADVVIGMERRHVREVAVLDRDAFERTFTLPELGRLAGAAGPRDPDEPLRGYLRRIAGDRRPGDLLGVGVDDEVADPYGRRPSAYREAAEAIESLLDLVVPHLFP